MSYVYECPKCKKSSCNCYQGPPGPRPIQYVAEEDVRRIVREELERIGLVPLPKAAKEPK